MLIYPAIDLIDGRCVRLLQGDFDRVTRYGDPVDQIKAFADAGATWIHIVDLDGARAGAPVQTNLMRQMSRAARIQSGGGVRSLGDVRALLDSGVSRVVVGSVAANEPSMVRDWLGEYGSERLCCAFDVRSGADGLNVAVSGWRETAALSLSAALDAFRDSPLKHVLITDIARDGALNGPNIALIDDYVRRYPALAIQASGGVSSLHDLTALRDAGAAGAIVGRALYEGRIDLGVALAS